MTEMAGWLCSEISNFGYRPQTTLDQGLQAFAEWYRWWEGQKAE